MKYTIHNIDADDNKIPVTHISQSQCDPDGCHHVADVFRDWSVRIPHDSHAHCTRTEGGQFIQDSVQSLGQLRLFNK